MLFYRRVTVIEAAGAVDAVWRIESARIIAGVARIVRDVGLAEELAQDALVAALEQWPESGVPNNPGAWLMAIAKRRAIDLIRRKETYQRKLAEIGHELEIDGDSVEDDVEAILEDHIEDDLLRLVFTACHPVLTMDARVTLTLRLLGGLKTDEIARAFLAPEPTIAQRIVRAKRNLAKAKVPVRGAGRRRAARAAGVGARGRLPDLQRGLLRDRRRRLDAPGAVQRGDAPRPAAGRADAGRARGPRPARADGAAGVACATRGSAPTASRSSCSTRTAAAGTAC